MAWRTEWAVDEDGEYVPDTPIHVYPEFGRQHDEEFCWCTPEIDGLLIVTIKTIKPEPAEWRCNAGKRP